MIYDLIVDEIQHILNEQSILDDEYIIESDNTANIKKDMFARYVWTYGLKDNYSNIFNNETSILVLELFERKYSTVNSIENIAQNIRDVIKIKSIIKNSNKTAVLNSISISINDVEDQWKGYNILFSFNIIGG